MREYVRRARRRADRGGRRSRAGTGAATGPADGLDLRTRSDRAAVGGGDDEPVGATSAVFDIDEVGWNALRWDLTSRKAN